MNEWMNECIDFENDEHRQDVTVASELLIAPRAINKTNVVIRRRDCGNKVWVSFFSSSFCCFSVRLVIELVQWCFCFVCIMLFGFSSKSSRWYFLVRISNRTRFQLRIHCSEYLQRIKAQIDWAKKGNLDVFFLF